MATTENFSNFFTLDGSYTIQVHASVEIDHPFRFNPITDFGLKRSPVSVLSDHF